MALLLLSLALCLAFGITATYSGAHAANAVDAVTFTVIGVLVIGLSLTVFLLAFPAYVPVPVRP